MIVASMSIGSAVAAEASAGHTVLLLAGLAVLALSARAMRAPAARVLRGPIVLFLVHLAFALSAAGLALLGSAGQGALRLLALMMAAVCAIKIVQELVFSLLLPRVGVRGSRILSDVVTACASIVAVFALASRAGFNVSGLIATSAVLTARRVCSSDVFAAFTLASSRRTALSAVTGSIWRAAKQRTAANSWLLKHERVRLKGPVA